MLFSYIYNIITIKEAIEKIKECKGEIFTSIVINENITIYVKIYKDSILEELGKSQESELIEINFLGDNSYIKNRI